MNVLFICTANKLRSPTAQAVFADDPAHNVRSAGLSRNCPQPLGEELIAWADILFVMERSHRNAVMKKYRRALSGKRLITLGIPDEYEYMDPVLIDILQRAVPGHLQSAEKGAR